MGITAGWLAAEQLALPLPYGTEAMPSGHNCKCETEPRRAERCVVKHSKAQPCMVASAPSKDRITRYGIVISYAG